LWEKMVGSKSIRDIEPAKSISVTGVSITKPRYRAKVSRAAPDRFGAYEKFETP